MKCLFHIYIFKPEIISINLNIYLGKPIYYLYISLNNKYLWWNLLWKDVFLVKRISFIKKIWFDKMRVFECANRQRGQQEMCATVTNGWSGRIVNNSKMIALMRGIWKTLTQCVLNTEKSHLFTLPQTQ